MHSSTAKKSIPRVKLCFDKPWAAEDFDLLEQRQALIARENFWAFRQVVNQNMLKGWWQREVAKALQQFFIDLKAGKRPKLVLQSPPQHGKSVQVADLISYIAGEMPELKTIFASFSDRLGVRANLRVQRTLDGNQYQKIFGPRLAPRSGLARSDGAPTRNREILEFVRPDEEGRLIPTEGYFRNTTVMGSVTGEGLDLGVIDDPLKGRAEASSKTIRDKTWDWMTDDFMSRFSEHAGLLMIMTRWHVDDPAGRMKEAFPELKFLQYPAIAIKDEEHRKKGEPLFPELKSLEFLNLQKKPMTLAGWESVYQQSPIIVGGGMFPIEKFGIPLMVKPVKQDVRRSVRAWDKAGTEGGGAYTAGVLMHFMRDGRFIVEDVVRGQWGAFERETIIQQTAVADNADGWSVDIWVEQEPGSGGKESAERTVVSLAGYNAYKDRVRGNKELRADPYAAQVQAGNVKLVRGKWNRDYLDEHETFPNGKYKDQVDAAGMAFAKLTSRIHEESEETALPIFGDANS